MQVRSSIDTSIVKGHRPLLIEESHLFDISVCTTNPRFNNYYRYGYMMFQIFLNALYQGIPFKGENGCLDC